MDIKKEQIESFREKLNDLPRYFTKEQFDGFVKQAEFTKYIKLDSPDPKNAILLSIYTQEWIVDSKKICCSVIRKSVIHGERLLNWTRKNGATFIEISLVIKEIVSN